MLGLLIPLPTISLYVLNIWFFILWILIIFILLHSSLLKYYDYLLVIFLHYGVLKIRLLLNQFVSMLVVYILRILIIKAWKILIKSWIFTFVEGCKSRKWKFWILLLSAQFCKVGSLWWGSFSCRAERRMKQSKRLFVIQCRVNNNMLAPVFSYLIS